jgi:hypothetical protein
MPGGVFCAYGEDLEQEPSHCAVKKRSSKLRARLILLAGLGAGTNSINEAKTSVGCRALPQLSGDFNGDYCRV